MINDVKRSQSDVRRPPSSPIGSSPLVCKYCKKSGHLIDKCYKLHGFPSDFKFIKMRKFVSLVQSDTSGDELLVSSVKLDDGNYRLAKDQFQHYQHLQHLHNTGNPAIVLLFLPLKNLPILQVCLPVPM